jgi:hypothetical protein
MTSRSIELCGYWNRLANDVNDESSISSEDAGTKHCIVMNAPALVEAALPSVAAMQVVQTVSNATIVARGHRAPNAVPENGANNSLKDMRPPGQRFNDFD